MFLKKYKCSDSGLMKDWCRDMFLVIRWGDFNKSVFRLDIKRCELLCKS